MGLERRVKRIEPIDRRAQLRLALKISVTILVTAGVLALLILLYRQQTSSSGIYRTEYEGRVIDKFATFVEKRTGSSVSRVLLIEDRKGLRFEVAVNRELFERVQKGMWIKSSSNGVELSWP